MESPSLYQTELPPALLKLARRIMQLETSGFREFKVRKLKGGGYALAKIYAEEDTSAMPDPLGAVAPTAK